MAKFYANVALLLPKGSFYAETFCQGRIEPPKAARGHVTSVNGKIQNNVIYRTSLLLLATPDVREIRGARRLHDVALTKPVTINPLLPVWTTQPTTVVFWPSNFRQ